MICCPFCRQISNYIDLDKTNIDLVLNSKSGKVGKCQYCLFCEEIEEACNTNQNNNLQKEFICSKCVIPDKFKQCPKCRSYIEKINGCNHIKCRCNHEFCWNCFDDWKSVKNANNHYNNHCHQIRS